MDENFVFIVFSVLFFCLTMYSSVYYNSKGPVEVFFNKIQYVHQMFVEKKGGQRRGVIIIRTSKSTFFFNMHISIPFLDHFLSFPLLHSLSLSLAECGAYSPLPSAPVKSNFHCNIITCSW